MINFFIVVKFGVNFIVSFIVLNVEKILKVIYLMLEVLGIVLVIDKIMMVIIYRVNVIKNNVSVCNIVF